MKKNPPKNIASSVRQKLLNISKQRNIDYQLLLTRYGLERFLYRLSQSRHKETFVLKGALLFLVWDKGTYRPTRDADLLGKGEHSLPHIKQVFQEICSVDVPDDGIIFYPDTVESLLIKEDQEYEGVRVIFTGKLTEAKIPMQVDIGFGDAVSPAPKQIEFPTLLDFHAPFIKAYPRETVVSEKFQAMVQLGVANSRTKDFYDIWIISEQFSFESKLLTEAIRKTFECRKTVIPSDLPFAFTPEFYENPTKQAQWKAFIQKNKLQAGETIAFSEVIDRIKAFIMPLLRGMNQKNDSTMIWTSDQGWK